MKKTIINGSFALVFASALSFGGGNAHASVNEITNASDQTAAPLTEQQTTVETSQTSPSLVPGDVFYFVKRALEQIQLSLTFDNEKEAKLLAQFATERLAEAEVLIADKKEDLAVKTLKEAIEEMEKANSQLEEKKEVKEKAEQESGKEDKEKEEVKQYTAQNIIALQAALEKVKNPTAKAALQKNIEKSYKKLEAKLAKNEEKAKADSTQLIEEENKVGQTLPTNENSDQQTKEQSEVKADVPKQGEPVSKKTVKNEHSVVIDRKQEKMTQKTAEKKSQSVAKKEAVKEQSNHSQKTAVKEVTKQKEKIQIAVKQKQITKHNGEPVNFRKAEHEKKMDRHGDDRREKEREK